MDHRRISIVVPVYGDWQSLSLNIKALKKSIGRWSKDQVYFINDCGPDVDMLEAKIKSEIVGRKNFHYYRNDKNIGFLKNCNNAVFSIINPKHDVLLLNSDAIVTKGFLKQMQKTLYAEENIGAVCPRSNSATIFSIPMHQDFTRPVTMKESYDFYKKIKNSLPIYYISPIAHGFCIMLRREVIDKFGLFDEVYGKGYGEENDLCMRIRDKGWVCAVTNRAYVYHYGSKSFGVEKRKMYIDKNEAILLNRYPRFREIIAEYVSRINEPHLD